MSSYFQGLPKDARDRYEQKLILSGLSLEEHPYSRNRNGEWSPDVARWPRIEYGDIFTYFISRPGTFTMEQLASWNCSWKPITILRITTSELCSHQLVRMVDVLCERQK